MTTNTNTQPHPVTAATIQRPRPSGGYSERPAAPRPVEQPRRDPPAPPNPTDQAKPADPAASATAPLCPACGKAMRLRTARKGPRAGSQFWGCTGFPECRKTLAV